MVAQFALITADNSDKGESLSFAETFFRDKTELGIDHCKYAQNNCYRASEWFNAAYDIAKSLAEQCSADDKERTMSCNDAADTNKGSCEQDIPSKCTDPQCLQDSVCDQIFPTAEEREQKCRANDSKQLFGCLYAPLCNPEKEYLSAKKTSACKWQNVTEADRQEIAIRRQYLSRSRESNYSVQTIDRYGNIILDGGYHQSVQFPLLLKVSEATLEISVCELPESECEPLDSEEDRLTLFRIIFEDKSTCDVDMFKTEAGPLGGQGRCRNGTWSIHNAIGSANFLVSIASNKKCKLIVEIKSTPFEHCFADWTPIFTRYNNDNVTEEHTLKITVGTNHRGRNEPSKDEEIYSLSKIAGQGKVLKLGGNSVVKDYFVHFWQKEHEKSFTDGNGTKFQVSMSNNYSHSVNKKLNFSMTIAEKSNLYTNVVIPSGRGVSISQLKIICTVIQHQSQFFLSDQMEWEPNVTILTDATTVDNSLRNNSAVTGAPSAESTKHQDSGVGHVSNDFFIFQWMLTVSAFSFLIDAYLL
ncbi:hypothetical protein Ddc_10127 [Ditylenchus destructor]|nr:hypothetical protein Ddc_10127 [Ditylenchus destructor]